MPDPVITYETRPAPALHFLVNFGLSTGREATRRDVRRLARTLLEVLPSVTIFSEHRFEVGARAAVDLHQIRVEVAHEALHAAEDVEALRATLTGLIVDWARKSVRSFPGELTGAEIAARDAVAEINADEPPQSARTTDGALRGRT